MVEISKTQCGHGQDQLGLPPHEGEAKSKAGDPGFRSECLVVTLAEVRNQKESQVRSAPGMVG
jgi:hypothetical protein